MLCLKRKLRIVFYPYIHTSARVILFPITLYFYFDDWQQLKHWAYKVWLWQNWKLEPNKHDF